MQLYGAYIRVEQSTRNQNCSNAVSAQDPNFGTKTGLGITFEQLCLHCSARELGLAVVL